MTAPGTRLALFFTWDVSLALWQEKGLLQREIRFYRELAKQGVDITFITWGDQSDIKIGHKAVPEIKIIPLYKYLLHPKSKPLRAIISLAAPFAARDALKKADIIKTNQMWGAWTAVLGKLMTGKPLLVRTGFELYDFTIRQGHKWPRRAFTWLISAAAYKLANLVHLATSEDRDFVVKNFKIPSSKIKIIPNWIDTEVFKPFSVHEKENSILYVGRLNAQKNLEQLIEAAADTDWTLDIIGDGELKDALRVLAARLKANVNFLGFQPNNALPGFYNQYPVFILPSHYEGNPKSLLEAMACGRAVIGADAPGISSLITHEETGLLCGHDAASIKAAIAHLMADKNLREHLGIAARRQIASTQALDRLIGEELASYQVLQGK